MRNGVGSHSPVRSKTLTCEFELLSAVSMASDAGELVSSTRMCAEPSDFPCINPDFTGLPHRFAYTTGYQPGTEPKNRMDIPSFDRVLKHDMQTGQSWEYRLGEGRACGDIVFVPTAAEGDDGDRLSSEEVKEARRWVQTV